jgi:hypothetical protein
MTGIIMVMIVLNEKNIVDCKLSTFVIKVFFPLIFIFSSHMCITSVMLLHLRI